MKAVLVFLAVAAADLLWTKYILAAADRHAMRAASYSAGIILIGGFTTLAYVSQPRYLLPAALGAFVGTWVSVRRA